MSEISFNFLVESDENLSENQLLCEVKNYKENAQVHPLLYIKTKQKDKILKTIQYYIHKENLYDRMIQFDILLIQDNKVKEHIKNVRLT